MAERLPDGGRRPCAQLEPCEGSLSVARDLGDETAVRRELVVVGEEALGLGLVLERVEEDGLADATQSADDHALLGRAALESPDEHTELLELGCSPGELGRPRAGIRGVGVRDRIQVLRSCTRIPDLVISG